MALIDELKKLIEQIDKRKVHVKGEESTKQALILPFIQLLGFDIYDPTEVKPEYVADFAKKKSSGQFEKIDYCLFIKDQASIFIECKAIGEILSIDNGQLARYFNSSPSVKLAVLTNGIEYQLYTDTLPNIMDEIPFCRFSLQSTPNIEDIKLLTKSSFSLTNIKQRVETSGALDRIVAYLQSIFINPSENFVRFVLTEAEITNSRLTITTIGRYNSVVKEAVNKIISKNDGITEFNAVTTVEELETFNLVKSICNKSIANSVIQYRDTAKFFSIEADNKWFLKLLSSERRKCFISRLSVEIAKIKAPGFQIEECSKILGESRIYFSSTSDLEKLSDFIIESYEVVVKPYEEYLIK